MSIENDKLMNLADGKVLYDDLRGRVDATKGMIAPDYADLTFPVLAGQGCIHDGVRYKAKQDISTSETWTAAHWEAEKIEGALSSVKSAIKAKADVIIDSASGAIVTLTDAVADEPLTGCVVTIDEDQTGFAGCNISRTGKNLLPTQNTVKSGNTTFVGDSDYWIRLKAGTYAMSEEGSSAYLYWRKEGTTDNNIIHTSSSHSGTFTLAEETTVRFWYYAASSDTTYSNIQLELGSTASAYEPFGNTYPVTFPITVTDGGSYDAATGVLTVNTDPVTTYQLDPVTIKTLATQGVNTIFADTGDVAVQYKADTKAYVDGHEGVTDVQVNGTSVVTDGVANVPKASTSVLGVVKTVSDYGTQMIGSNNDMLATSRAQDTHIKAGTNQYKPIVPVNQHESVFYGLAKAAGNTDQASSSNAVGVYTEDALSKIHDMIDAPVNVSGSTPSITAKPGVRYVCGECATLTIVAPASGCIDVTFTSGSTATVLTVSSAKTGVTAIKWANGFDPSSLEANTRYEILIDDGEWGMVASWT